MVKVEKVDVLDNKIVFYSVCSKCNNQNAVNMSYEHAAQLFHGQMLNFICQKCNVTYTFSLSNVKHVIDSLSQKKKNHFYDFLSSYSVSNPPQKEVVYYNNTSSGGEWVGIILFVLIVIGVFWWFGHSGIKEDTGGMTYNYVCAYEANQLAEQSKQIVQKMNDMGCSVIVVSDALYARCMELKAENDQKIRDWKALSCTDNTKLT